MKEDITAKLSRALAADIKTENQVVYILVEARKLLEQQDALKNFRTLKLCCDWAVHPKLDQGGARDVLKVFDDYEIEFLKTGISTADYAPLRDFAMLTSFRAELAGALAPFGVDVQCLSSRAYWQSFIRQYVSVIQDCPLQAREGATKHVTHVTGVAWPDDQAGAVFPGKFVLQWNWKLKSGRERETRETCALF
jgi:hypothetical protein